MNHSNLGAPSTNVLSRSAHRDLILDQFTAKAEAFATAPAIANAEALKLLVDLSGAAPDDTMLDVACGPGLLVCAFAGTVRHATGIDITPAMIERARTRQLEQGLANVSWHLGDALPLPFPDASFSIVTSRYAFHHFQDPAGVMREMARACSPGGRIVLADVHASADPAQASAFNRMEKLRDPSHVRAMPLVELHDLIENAGLRLLETGFYGLDWELENLLKGSSPGVGAADQIRKMFVEDPGKNEMAIRIRREGAFIWFTYPIVVMVAQKP